MEVGGMGRLIDPTSNGLVSRLREGDREFLEELWADYAPYADNNFPSELHKNLHPRFWEMYLTVSLLKQRKQVLSRSGRMGEGGPDTCVLDAGRHVWLEAIAPDRGCGDDAVPEMQCDGKCRDVPDEEIILRYRSGIHDKFRKLKSYLRTGTVRPHEPFVIALSGGGVPNVHQEQFLPRIIHALFPLGHYTVTVNPQTFDVVGEGFARREVLRKVNGAPVQTDVSLDSDYAPISGVLFSYADVCNAPVVIGADFVFCHNPLASTLLPRGWLRIGREYWFEGGELRHRIWSRKGWGEPRWLYYPKRTE
jgi:hypothetical protein